MRRRALVSDVGSTWLEPKRLRLLFLDIYPPASGCLLRSLLTLCATVGFLQLPAFAAVSQYFDKNRAAALGLAVSGSSIGGIIMPIALSKMLNGSSLGFGWSVRVIGFLILPFITFACVAIKARLPARKTNFWIMSAYREPRFIMLTIAMFFMFVECLRRSSTSLHTLPHRVWVQPWPATCSPSSTQPLRSAALSPVCSLTSMAV